MIRITNTLDANRNISTKKTYLVSLLPGWLLNDDYNASHSCVMTNISSGGAAILIPRSQATLVEEFDLAFLSPDNEDEILTILIAEQRWKDEDYSPEHIKIGVVFSQMNLIKTQVINAMIEIFNMKNTIPKPAAPYTDLLKINVAKA